MPRYIDADKLKVAFHADTEHLQSRDEHLFDLIMFEIDEAPTAVVVESMQAQCKELKIALDRAMDEKSKIGVMYEELLKEKAVLEKRIEFYCGQIEAYRYCIDKRGN